MNVRPVPRVSSARPRPPAGWRYRLAVAARTGAGLLGGYALAAFFTTTVALLARAPREEAAMLGAVPSFLVFAAAIVWTFTARTAARAWAGIGLPLLVLAALTWWLSRSAP
jgi:Protein of unknown function (DUF3649)